MGGLSILGNEKKLKKLTGFSNSSSLKTCRFGIFFFLRSAITFRKDFSPFVVQIYTLFHAAILTLILI
jgi:hypothetical protein